MTSFKLLFKLPKVNSTVRQPVDGRRSHRNDQFLDGRQPQTKMKIKKKCPLGLASLLARCGIEREEESEPVRVITHAHIMSWGTDATQRATLEGAKGMLQTV